MANEYAVNHADLTAVAGAIRAKGGTSEALAFPGGFVEAVEAIQAGGGGGDSMLDELISNTVESISTTVTTVRQSAFMFATKLISANLPNATSFGGNVFEGCTSLREVNVPSLTSMKGHVFKGCLALTNIVFPELTTISDEYAFYRAVKLEKVDFHRLTYIQTNTFFGCSALKCLILRKNDAICSLKSTSAFGSTPFASNGTGGTIYIPKVLYDQLGTGSALDYKAATNWSTIDAYGTITWAQIEGSEYE